MKRWLCLSLIITAAVSTAARCEQKSYPYRWVRVARSLDRDSHVEDIREIARTASEHGLNGILLWGHLDRMDLEGDDYIRRLGEVKEICRNYNVEIIPAIMNVGYGNSVLAHNKNLAAGLPVEDALFVVDNGSARHRADPPVNLVNGGFEDHAGNWPNGYFFAGSPSEVIFIDTNITKEGRAALRFENFDKFPPEQGRVSQDVSVRPYRSYRLSCWMRSEDLVSPDRWPPEHSRIQVRAEDGRDLQYFYPELPSNSGWRKLVVGFNSMNYDKVRISFGVWGRETGKLWVDDIRLEEVGLVNVLRRPGAPLEVRSEQKGIIYEEGRDYAPVADPDLTFRFDHDGPDIRIKPGGRIEDGERLRVSYYNGVSVKHGQVSLCMSEAETYEIWRKQVKLIERYLAPKKYFLLIDEIRAGGTCKACRERGIAISRILGSCVTQQFNIIREANKEAEVFIWADLFNPYHNAGEHPWGEDFYFLVDGLYTGSLNYIPKELVITCWHHPIRRESLNYFSNLGFRTMGAAYYDEDSLDNPRDWLDALDNTRGARGIIYTTWTNKYELLGPFGDLVTRRK